jgi:hypothetical protein
MVTHRLSLNGIHQFCRIVPFAESINETSVAIYALEAKVCISNYFAWA